MRFSLPGMLASFDSFGHRPKLTYKGKEMHKTYFGGFCSLGVKVMTLILLAVALNESVSMDDPGITSFARPLSKQEKHDLGPVNFADRHYSTALLAFINGKFAQVPPEVGRLAAYAEYRSFDNTTQAVKTEEIQL